MEVEVNIGKEEGKQGTLGVVVFVHKMAGTKLAFSAWQDAWYRNARQSIKVTKLNTRELSPEGKRRWQCKPEK